MVTGWSSLLSMASVESVRVNLFSPVRSILACQREASMLTAMSNTKTSRKLHLLPFIFFDRLILAVVHVIFGDKKHKVNTAKEINYIPAVNHTPAHAAVMKIDANHFNVIICISGKYGYAT